MGGAGKGCVFRLFNELCTPPLGLSLTSLRTSLAIPRGSIKRVNQRVMGTCSWYFYHVAGPIMPRRNDPVMYFKRFLNSKKLLNLGLFALSFILKLSRDGSMV